MKTYPTRAPRCREVPPTESAKKKLKERLEFEALLSDLSARFVNLAPEAVDRGIEGALKALLDFFQVDRAGLVRGLLEKNLFEITHPVRK